MGGGLMSYGDALKAFRRGCHQFPGEGIWRCVVICSTVPQADLAFREAVSVLEASTLAVEHANYTGRQIKIQKGGDIRFCVTDEKMYDRLRGCNVPHFIVLSAVSDQTREVMERTNRHHHVDQKFCRIDEATL